MDSETDKLCLEGLLIRWKLKVAFTAGLWTVKQTVGFRLEERHPMILKL